MHLLPRFVPRVAVQTKSDKRGLDSMIFFKEEFKSFGISQIIECSAEKEQMQDLTNVLWNVLNKP